MARLFKSTPVKNVVPNILAEIKKLLGLQDLPVGKQSKSGAKSDAPSKEKSEKRVPGAKEKPESGSDVEEDEQKDSRSRTELSVSGDEGSGSEDFSKFDTRLAPGSGSEDESDLDEDMSDADNRALAADDISDSVSRSPSPAFSAENSPPPKKTKAGKASSAPVQSTTFLPSLMMGGYWSGSEEATDDEAAAGPPKRKNRMGQQARRALWEKKYGAKANHIQEEQKKQKRNRDSGWDTRRGATGANAGALGRGGNRLGRGKSGADSGPGSHSTGLQNQAKGPPKDSGPLHPSWEAKRRQKEQATTATFQGKKVVFD